MAEQPTNQPPSGAIELLSAPIRDERGRLLPGNNLNPSGRGKADRALREACRLVAEEQVPKVLAIINADDTPPHVKLDGIKMLWERAYGRAPIALPDDDGIAEGMLVLRFARPGEEVAG